MKSNKLVQELFNKFPITHIKNTVSDSIEITLKLNVADIFTASYVDMAFDSLSDAISYLDTNFHRLQNDFLLKENYKLLKKCRHQRNELHNIQKLLKSSKT